MYSFKKKWYRFFINTRVSKVYQQTQNVNVVSCEYRKDIEVNINWGRLLLPYNTASRRRDVTFTHKCQSVTILRVR